jgi:AmmeMemoRadiSam system protein B
VGELMRQIQATLSENGLLEDAVFERLRQERHQTFAQATRRLPAYAGSAYPSEADALRQALRAYMEAGSPATPAPARLVGIGAPHVSPEGGFRCYRDAYAALAPEHRQRTFVILGTSHYGAPDRFGLTRKPFVTPLGEAPIAVELAESLLERGGPAVVEEDYCHAVEHSIEFQVVFLQHLLGPDVRIVPVLCGPLSRGESPGERPEDHAPVARFFRALGELAAREGERLLWVLGVDMAHQGQRYGDPFVAEAERGPLAEVAVRDRERIARLAEGDADGFWRLVRGGHDELKWCGASPLYTFLRAVGPVRAELRRYEQWNIDPASVVSFASLLFTRA